MARNIVTFDKYQKPRNDCRDEGHRDDYDAVFLLAQNLTALNARFAFVESEQTSTINDVVTRLDQILDLLLAGGVLPVPPALTNTVITAAIPYENVTGAAAAFDALQSTADDQDDRLTQLEAA